MYDKQRLEDITQSVEYGLTASATSLPKGPKFLRITDIQNGAVNWNTVPYCVCSATEVDKYAIQAGDIVFARTGATTGKSFLVGQVQEETVFASYLIRVRPSKNVLPEYLFQFFQTGDYWKQISTHSTGTAQPGVNGSKLKELVVPCPPMAEQKRIAAILDEADALRRKRREAIAKLDALLQSVFLDMFGDPATNTMAFEAHPLSQLTTYVSSGVTPLGGSSVYVRSGKLFIRSQNVLMNRFDFSDIAYITGAMHKRMERTWVKRGDVLLNITGASIGRVHLYDAEDDQANVNQHVCILRPDQKQIHPAYLSRFLSFPSYQAKILGQNSGATRQAFNFEQIKKFEILLPALSLQRQFAERVIAINLMRQQSEGALQQLEALYSSLQNQAFSSELTGAPAERMLQPCLTLDF